MRLKHLYIKDYKNLKDFSLDFENGNGLSILIGNNGSGKSNVLEAISGIFAEAFWNDSSFKMRLKVLQLNNKENEGITDEKFVDREFSESLLPPYIFDDATRAVLRAELDAILRPSVRSYSHRAPVHPGSALRNGPRLPNRNFPRT